MERVEHDLSDEQWAALKAAWGGCAYCGATGTPLQRDCVLPISRGGRYTLDNIAPACGSCNASKCNDEVTGWLRRKRLDERAFLLRHVEISAALAAAVPERAGLRPGGPVCVHALDEPGAYLPVDDVTAPLPQAQPVHLLGAAEPQARRRRTRDPAPTEEPRSREPQHAHEAGAPRPIRP